MNEDQNPDEALNPQGANQQDAIKKNVLMLRLLEKIKMILIHQAQTMVKQLLALLVCIVSGFWTTLVMLF